LKTSTSFPGRDGKEYKGCSLALNVVFIDRKVFVFACVSFLGGGIHFAGTIGSIVYALQAGQNVFGLQQLTVKGREE